MYPHSILLLSSYPKVNLALDILRKDPTGYHEIQTVFHQLSEPVDEIVLESCGKDVLEVKCDNPKVPIDKTNTVLKAALLLKDQTQIKKGARIFIKKRIPLMSGLGGGASNAVTALKGLAKLWGVECCSVTLPAPSGVEGRHSKGDMSWFESLTMTLQEPHHDASCLLRRIADQIGMDCAFFFGGGTALGEHFGEKVTTLPPLPTNIYFEIIETGVEISSHAAYAFIDIKKCRRNLEKTKKLIKAIRAQDTASVLENLHNDFEEFVFEKYPQLLDIKKRFESKKPCRVLLCGSGGNLIKIETTR